MKKRAAAKLDCIRGGCASWPVKASLRHQYTKKIGRLFRKPGFSASSAAASAAITADELIELQARVKQAYQGGACWIMNPATFTLIKKLKDANNRYLLQDDATGEFPYRLLGKPVFLSDNMPAAAAGAKAVLYGDCSGLSVNFRENISIEVLREVYAAQHAIGVVSWFEFDSKVTDNQKLAVLTMKAGS